MELTVTIFNLKGVGCMSKTGIEKDEHGNICHVRSGKIIKRRVVLNERTGESDYVITNFGRHGEENKQQ